MRFALVFGFLAAFSTVLATPTGHTFIRASCDIAGCVAALAPSVVSCVGAAAQEGANIIADAACLAAAANTIANFPPDCDQCAEEFDLAGKAAAAGNKVKGAVKGAVDEVGDVAGNVGDKIGDVAGSVGDKLGSIF